MHPPKKNPGKIARVFLNYLNAYPDTTVGAKIETEILRITEQINEIRIENERRKIRDVLKPATDRFTEEVKGVVTDNHSGLMWTLLDSRQATTQCFDYSDAIAYVKTLSTGDYKDWRLPALDEIREFYNGDTVFPGTPGEWFWTADKYTRYADGWITEVRTLEKRADNQWFATKHDARFCGSVRAVRP